MNLTDYTHVRILESGAQGTDEKRGVLCKIARPSDDGTEAYVYSTERPDACDDCWVFHYPQKDNTYEFVKISSPNAGPLVVAALSEYDVDLDSATATERKHVPIYTGFMDYFPDAVAAVAAVSWTGNEQHNPGEPLHWSREKSNDHADCVGRHMLQRGEIDDDGHRHTAKAAWRVMAILQLEIEDGRGS